MMDVLQDIICKLEVRTLTTCRRLTNHFSQEHCVWQQCRLQHVGGQISRKVKCVDAADFIDVLIGLFLVLDHAIPMVDWLGLTFRTAALSSTATIPVCLQTILWLCRLVS